MGFGCFHTSHLWIKYKMLKKRKAMWTWTQTKVGLGVGCCHTSPLLSVFFIQNLFTQNIFWLTFFLSLNLSKIKRIFGPTNFYPILFTNILWKILLDPKNFLVPIFQRSNISFGSKNVYPISFYHYFVDGYFYGSNLFSNIYLFKKTFFNPKQS